MTDSSGVINLQSLAAVNGAKWDSIDGNGDGFSYSFNPCNGFHTSMFNDLAVIS